MCLLVSSIVRVNIKMYSFFFFATFCFYWSSGRKPANYMLLRSFRMFNASAINSIGQSLVFHSCSKGIRQAFRSKALGGAASQLTILTLRAPFITQGIAVETWYRHPVAYRDGVKGPFTHLCLTTTDWEKKTVLSLLWLLTTGRMAVEPVI